MMKLSEQIRNMRCTPYEIAFLQLETWANGVAELEAECDQLQVKIDRLNVENERLAGDATKAEVGRIRCLIAKEGKL